MESSLHRSLKERYATGAERRLEVFVRGYRIDAIDAEGRLIEVQSGPLGPLRGKLGCLLADHRVRIVKPVVLERRIVRRARREGPDLSARRSPRRGALHDVFEDLVGLARVFPHANLEIEVLGVGVEEVRTPRRRWPGHAVVDRRLGAVHARASLVRAEDLWALLPGDWAARAPFTTLDLARRLDRPIAFAQRVAYCLRCAGAASAVGKTGNRVVYARGAHAERPAGVP